jgi:hypothetical protein
LSSRLARLLLGVSGLMLAATPAMAQQAVAADDEAGEILVTARRNSERLIDVPASVSVVTAETLAATGTFRSQDELLQRDLFERRAAFDMDTYKLLVAHLMRNRRARVMPLAETGSELRAGARH